MRILDKAIVLLTLEATVEQTILNKLMTLEGVIEAHFLYGPFDAYVKIVAENSQQLQDIIINQIRNIEGIRSTMTCFVSD
jgi:DNA-binding Lrp family transcriptional regulator